MTSPAVTVHLEILKKIIRFIKYGWVKCGYEKIVWKLEAKKLNNLSSINNGWCRHKNLRNKTLNHFIIRNIYVFEWSKKKVKRINLHPHIILLSERGLPFNL